MRLLCSNNGLTVRSGGDSGLDPRDYVYSSADYTYATKDLDAEGAPKPGAVPTGIKAGAVPLGPKPGLLVPEVIVAEPDEIVFDHVPTEAELLAAFPGRTAALAQKAKDEANAPIVAELTALDAFLPRAIEDQWAATAFDTTKLPQAQQDRLARKQALRAQFQH